MDYKIGKEISKGTYGTVFLAENSLGAKICYQKMF